MNDQPEELSDLPDTRMIFMGDASLTDGFRLIGFQTWADPSMEEMEQILEELMQSRSSAFIILDSHLAEAHSAVLQRVRTEGGRIIITEVPPLNEPDNFHRDIDDKVQSLLGSEMERQD